VDHRLGSHHRIRRREHCRRYQLGELLQNVPQRVRRIVPDWLSMDYRTAAKSSMLLGYRLSIAMRRIFGAMPIICNLLAVSIVAAITLFLIWGIRESARVNAVMVGVKLLVLLFFVVVGSRWVQPAN
jgi:hypothetical protein